MRSSWIDGLGDSVRVADTAGTRVLAVPDDLRTGRASALQPGGQAVVPICCSDSQSSDLHLVLCLLAERQPEGALQHHLPSLAPASGWC